MLRPPVLVRRRPVAALAGLLGTFAALAPATVAAQQFGGIAPASPPGAGFVQAAPALPGPTFGGPIVTGPIVTGPGFGPSCGVPGPLCAAPPPCPDFCPPRRVCGPRPCRPFGLPLLSEVGCAIGRGVEAIGEGVGMVGRDMGVVGAGVGGFADDLLHCPAGHGCRSACAPPCPRPICVVPQIEFLPLAPACPPPCPPPACAAPAPICAAPAPICAAPPVCETELVPRTTTKYARRECVTWKEVECVAYRHCREEYVEPVCRTECRTVDRGCWKRVWVPKMVTEEYTTTDYVRRCRVRRVPYTYTKQVAERRQQLVPYCATTFVPRPVRACLPEPDCGAPDFAPRFAPPAVTPPTIGEGIPYQGAEAPAFDGYGLPEHVVPQDRGEIYGGEIYGGESFDGGTLGGESYRLPSTGVPNVEYALPSAPPAGAETLRPIPEDNFSRDADDAPGLTPEPEDGDRTSLAPHRAARTAARGWTEQTPRARF